MTTPPDSTKLPRVEDRKAPPARAYPYEESENREQKLPSPIQTTPSSEATRKEYNKKLLELVNHVTTY